MAEQSKWIKTEGHADESQECYHRVAGNALLLQVHGNAKGWRALISAPKGARYLSRSFTTCHAAQMAVELHALNLLRGAIKDLTGEGAEIAEDEKRRLERQARDEAFERELIARRGEYD